MNGLLVAAMVMGGSSGVALTNETVRDTVSETATQTFEKVQNMFKGTQIETVRAEGFAYPSEEYLAGLTEDQAFQVVLAIDVINATYDWANMTDEEIIDALAIVKLDLQELYDELGIEGPTVQTQARKGYRGSKSNSDSGDDLVPSVEDVPLDAEDSA
jgi:hypothetical protein